MNKKRKKREKGNNKKEIDRGKSVHKIAGRGGERWGIGGGKADRMEVGKGSEGEGEGCVICNPILS